MIDRLLDALMSALWRPAAWDVPLTNGHHRKVLRSLSLQNRWVWR